MWPCPQLLFGLRSVLATANAVGGTCVLLERRKTPDLVSVNTGTGGQILCFLKTLQFATKLIKLAVLGDTIISLGQNHEY